MKIKILGVDNIRRKKLENTVKKSLKKLSLVADIQIVSVLDDILKYDVAGIPALLVDEVIICQKCVPNDVKILNWLKEIVEKNDKDSIKVALTV
ncbi:MAG: hypothetical protein ACI9XO_000804 [Paraglaciecola sp.]|jgi:hypothetical protein